MKNYNKLLAIVVVAMAFAYLVFSLPTKWLVANIFFIVPAAFGLLALVFLFTVWAFQEARDVERKRKGRAL